MVGGYTLGRVIGEGGLSFLHPAVSRSLVRESSI